LNHSFEKLLEEEEEESGGGVDDPVLLQYCVHDLDDRQPQPTDTIFDDTWRL
jgi:hypothetical protein